MAAPKNTSKNSGMQLVKATSATRSKTASKKNTSTSKKTTKPKQEYSYSEPEKNSLKDEALAILAIAAAFLLVLALFTDGGAGSLGGHVKNALTGLFGFGAYIMPFMIIAGSIFSLFTKGRSFDINKVALMSALFFAIISFVAVMRFASDKTAFVFNFDGIMTAYALGAVNNGGVFGGIIGGFLLLLLGAIGSYVILIFLGIALLVLISGKSLFAYIQSLMQYLKDNLHERKMKRLEEQEYYEEYGDEDYYEDYEEEIELTKKTSAANNVNSKLESKVYSNKNAVDIPRVTLKKPLGKVLDHVIKVSPENDKNQRLELLADDLKERKRPEFVIDSPNKYDGKAIDVVPYENGNEESETHVLIHESTASVKQPKINIIGAAKIPQSVKIEPPVVDVGDKPPFDVDDAISSDISIKGSGIEGYVPVVVDSEGEVLPLEPGAKQTAPTVSKVFTGAPSEEKEEFVFPPVELLKENIYVPSLSSKAQILENSRKLEETLKSFGVEAKVVEVSKGPTVTRYELSPGQGVKVSRISGLADDLALNLAAHGIRIEAPIPGKSVVGIEIPNKEVQSVYLREVLDDEAFWAFPSKLAFAVGKDIAGNTVIADIAKMPHLLIAGSTGSGKSVCINTLITSMLYKATPDEVKIIMIDPKVVELSIYNGIPHLLIPVVTDPKKAAGALNWAVREMDQRYNLLAESHSRDLKGYNASQVSKGEKPLPQIVIIIDELADLMMTCGKEVEESICRLAQKARAAGIHLIVATQRPSVDVITGLIKTNVPSRLAFAVSSGVDSRTILDMVGAEKLLGKGDMLFSPMGVNKPQRIQGSFISDKEVENIVNFLKENTSHVYDPEMIEKVTAPVEKGINFDEDSDDLIEQSIEFVVDKEKASTSMLQRKFRIGYNRAARIVEELEDRGIVGPEDGSKPRKVLMTRYQWQDYKERRETE